MNIDRENIIRMAREAGSWETDTGELVTDDINLERFAALVAAASAAKEREEIKAICAAEQSEDTADLWNVCCKHIIDKINERKV